MLKFSHLTLVASCTFLVACSPLGNTPPSEEEQSPSPANGGETAQEDSAPRETPNVTYKGIVQPAGISIYQQGSHRLVLDDNRFILLESAQVDLNGYVGESVEAFGSIRPTVEEGGIIMSVENIRLEAQDVEEDSEAEEASVSEESTQGDENDGGDSVEEETSEDLLVEEEEADTSSIPTETDTTDEPENGLLDSDVNEPTVLPLSADKLESVIAMSKDSYSPERWTQQYCTGHIGFCMPVHKNWWYKSFGNTTTNLWQVELRNMPIEQIGDGVITVKLVSGTAASVDATDVQVRVQGDQVTGYRSWEGGTHFEIVADARLVEAVTYITEHVTPYQE
ncbi:MAG: hypothetical protein PHU04_02830 [Candidatus Peribacteraceae bacterium]|nr:hypothetical protein [Candidatus Peribacteraceae bacterium]